MVAFAAVSCGGTGNAQVQDNVSVQLQWFHQAQFAGYYAADVNGHYETQGIGVELLRFPGVGADVIDIVLDGGADFGTASAGNILLAKDQGKPVVAIATIFRRDPFVFLSLEGSEIKRPHDFVGRTVRVRQDSAGESILRSMLERTGLSIDDVDCVFPDTDMSLFLDGGVDVWAGYLTSQVIELEELGVGFNIILPSDYGIREYRDTIFTSERLIEEDPDLVARFLRATLEGWRWAVGHPTVAGSLALSFDASLDEATQSAQMIAMIPLIHTGEDELGWMDQAVWHNMAERLSADGLIQEPDGHELAFTTRFLDLIYLADQ